MRFKNNRPLRTISLLIVVAVLIATLGGCFPDRAGLDAVKQANARVQAKAELARLARERGKPTTAEKLTNVTKDLRASLAKIAEGKTQDKATLKAAKSKLAALDQTIRGELQQTEDKITKINAKRAIARQKKFVADYNRKMAKLNRELNSAISADNKTFAGKAKILSDYVATLIPEEKHQPLGTSLPHRNVDYNAGEPILGANIAPAYMATTPNLEPSTLPRTPTADDLAATIDTSQTQAIKDLADKLGKDPVKMYEFVLNNIVFEPYFGSRKGAQETLWEKGGNDIDQANLLIALYRYSGIPARYVTGVVEIPIDQAMNWVGVEKPEVAAKVFSAAGIPTTAIIRGGKIDAVRIEHIWVEGYVDMGQDLGVDAADGQKVWTALDASFKQYDYKSPMDLQAKVSFDATAFVQQIVASATIDTTLGSITNIDTSFTQNKIAAYQKETTSYLENNYPNLSVSDLIGKRTIKAEALGLLPNNLAIKTISTEAEWAGVPADRRDSIAISAPGLNLSASLPEVAGKSITLSYVAATVQDKTLLSQYTSLKDVPAYLIEMLPVVEVDGNIVATGDQPLPMGSDHAFDMNLSPVGLASQRISNSAVAGSYYAITLNLGRISKESVSDNGERLKDAATKIQALAEGTTSPINLMADDYIGALLHLSGSTYFAQLDMLNSLTARLSGVVYQRDVSEAMTGVGAKQSSVFGITTSINPNSLFFDVDGDNFFAVAKDGNADKANRFASTAGIVASHLEGTTYSTLFGSQAEGVSTMSLLRQANSQGVPVYTVTGDNINQVLPKLSVSAGVKEDISNAVNQGRTVTIPERNLTTSEGWSGTGYIIADPATGAAGYMISGGTAGGFLPLLVAVAGPAGLVIGRLLDYVLLVDAVQKDGETYPWFEPISPNLADAGWAMEFVQIAAAYVTTMYQLEYNQNISESLREKLQEWVAIATGVLITLVVGAVAIIGIFVEGAAALTVAALAVSILVFIYLLAMPLLIYNYIKKHASLLLPTNYAFDVRNSKVYSRNSLKRSNIEKSLACTG